MDFFNILILSIVQGITEFLPISSSGHLILVAKFLNINDSVLFNLALHLGTTLALICYFHKEIYKILHTFIFYITGNKKDLYIIPHIILSTFPAALIGIFLMLIKFDMDKHDTILIFAINSIIFGIILYLADKYSHSSNSFNNITKKQSFIIGIAQVLAIIPGVSRLGICMTAARYTKIDRVSSVKYSMLISIPIILGGALLKITPLFKQDALYSNEFLLGIIFSFLTGLCFLKILLNFVAKYNFKIFMYYRVILGISVLVYFYIF